MYESWIIGLCLLAGAALGWFGCELTREYLKHKGKKQWKQ